jgi:hypothetical protein
LKRDNSRNEKFAYRAWELWQQGNTYKQLSDICVIEFEIKTGYHGFRAWKSRISPKYPFLKQIVGRSNNKTKKSGDNGSSSTTAEVGGVTTVELPVVVDEPELVQNKE